MNRHKLEYLNELAQALADEGKPLAATCVRLLMEERADLLTALSDLLKVIAVDDLIPESVSYMRQARATIASATGEAAKP